jgi:hypothetical protein
MKKILFINRRAKNCGVRDYGFRLHNIVKKSNLFDILFSEIDNDNDFKIVYNDFKPDIVLYNYISHIYPFLTDELIAPIRNIPHIILYHEGSINFHPDGLLCIDSTINDDINKNIFSLPRPLFEEFDLYDFPENKVPTIGSFGFGFADKNFPKIAELVCKQFDKAKIRLNIPFATFGDEHGNSAKNEIEKIKQIIKNSNKDISLEYSHDFLESTDILKFLKQNDVNVFLYDKHSSRGLSSAIDYSLSVKKPIAINDSFMFRHINNTQPSIIVSDDNTLLDIIKNGTQPLDLFYEKYSNINLKLKFENSINMILNKLKV